MVCELYLNEAVILKNDRCREQTYGHQGGKVAGWGDGGGMKWEVGIDMYTLICIKWMTNKNLLYKKINKIKFKKKKSPHLHGNNSLVSGTDSR